MLQNCKAKHWAVLSALSGFKSAAWLSHHHHHHHLHHHHHHHLHHHITTSIAITSGTLPHSLPPMLPPSFWRLYNVHWPYCSARSARGKRFWEVRVENHQQRAPSYFYHSRGKSSKSGFIRSSRICLPPWPSHVRSLTSNVWSLFINFANWFKKVNSLISGCLMHH